MRVAVLGLGRMGEALALRLLDGGCEVVVWNRSPAKADGLVAGGAEAAADVPSACQDAEIVVTCLADDGAVRQVALGSGGVREHGSAAVYVDSSTISPALSAELAAVRRNGYATAIAELEDGLVAVASPVLDATGACVAALSVSGPAFRMRPESLDELGRLCAGA